jgi:hypothetical protein
MTKEIGNMIISTYENVAAAINEQRCENLKLQMELATLNKEKNTLRHDISNLIISVRKMENFLGVEPDPKFDNTVNSNLY